MRNKIIKLFNGNQLERIINLTIMSTLINLAYAVYNGGLAIFYGSKWFLIAFFYYLVLTAMRIVCVRYKKRYRHKRNREKEQMIAKLDGMLMLIFAVIQSRSIYVSLNNNIVTRYNKIVMITIATYTFYKITMSIINLIKSRRTKDNILILIRNIGLCDGMVSIMSLELSMNMTFGNGLTKNNIMEIITGAFVCISIAVIGIATYKSGKA